MTHPLCERSLKWEGEAQFGYAKTKSFVGSRPIFFFTSSPDLAPPHSVFIPMTAELKATQSSRVDRMISRMLMPLSIPWCDTRFIHSINLSHLNCIPQAAITMFPLANIIILHIIHFHTHKNLSLFLKAIHEQDISSDKTFHWVHRVPTNYASLSFFLKHCSLYVE